MLELSKEWEGFAPRIEKSSDSVTESAIKKVISQMLQFEPANRITAKEVVKRLTKLKAGRKRVDS